MERGSIRAKVEAKVMQLIDFVAKWPILNTNGMVVDRRERNILADWKF